MTGARQQLRTILLQLLPADFPHQFFFPMAGKDEGWMKLK